MYNFPKSTAELFQWVGYKWFIAQKRESPDVMLTCILYVLSTTDWTHNVLQLMSLIRQNYTSKLQTMLCVLFSVHARAKYTLADVRVCERLSNTFVHKHVMVHTKMYLNPIVHVSFSFWVEYIIFAQCTATICALLGTLQVYKTSK